MLLSILYELCGQIIEMPMNFLSKCLNLIWLSQNKLKYIINFLEDLDSEKIYILNITIKFHFVRLFNECGIECTKR